MLGRRYNKQAFFQIAEDAKNIAEKTQLEQVKQGERLEAHLKSCETFGRDLREDLREWRVGLGSRLDRQDRIMFSALGMGFLTLLSVAGYLISKLPVFGVTVTH